MIKSCVTIICMIWLGCKIVKTFLVLNFFCSNEWKHFNCQLLDGFWGSGQKFKDPLRCPSFCTLHPLKYKKGCPSTRKKRRKKLKSSPSDKEVLYSLPYKSTRCFIILYLWWDYMYNFHSHRRGGGVLAPHVYACKISIYLFLRAAWKYQNPRTNFDLIWLGL